MTRETLVAFPCEGDWLYGVVHLPDHPAPRGVLVVVGGPQYRVGSHRQFLLLARVLADSAIPVMRFDYRGMGDSEGAAITFEDIETDIRCAIDAFFAQVPSMREVVLWGLCDAASAALMYAHCDRRVSGVALLNPWVRTEQGIARAYLKHYYMTRLFDPDLWRKIRAGRFSVTDAAKSLFHAVGTGLGLAKSFQPASDPAAESRAPDTGRGATSKVPLPERMLTGFKQYGGRIMIILSGDDLTAREFKDLATTARPWRKLLRAPRVTSHELAAANHTFARRAWRDQVAKWTAEWVKSW
jgi:exosortase A-associated hydrolase 1